MRFNNATEVNDFISTVKDCKGSVWLESQMGDKFVLNSEFSRYIAIAALLEDKGEQLELFCSDPEDETKFYKYFREHPEV